MLKFKYLFLLLLLPSFMLAQFVEIDHNEFSLQSESGKDIAYNRTISKVISTAQFPCMDNTGNCVGVTIANTNLELDTTFVKQDVVIYDKSVASFGDLFLLFFKDLITRETYIEAFESNGSASWKIDLYNTFESNEDFVVSDFEIEGDVLYVMFYDPAENLDFVMSYDLINQVAIGHVVFEEGQSRSGNLDLYNGQIIISRSTYEEDNERGFVVLDKDLEIVNEVYFPFNNFSSSYLFSCILGDLIILTTENQRGGGIYGLTAYTLAGEHQWTIDVDGTKPRKVSVSGMFSRNNLLYIIGKSEYNGEYYNAGVVLKFNKRGQKLENKYFGAIEESEWLPYHFVRFRNVAFDEEGNNYFTGIIMGTSIHNGDVVNGNQLVLKVDSSLCFQGSCAGFTHLDGFHELVDTNNFWTVKLQPFDNNVEYRFDPVPFYFDSIQGHFVGWLDYGDKYTLQRRNVGSEHWIDTDTILIESMGGEVRIVTSEGEALLYDMRAEYGDIFVDLHQASYLMVVDKDSILLEDGTLRTRIHLTDPLIVESDTTYWIEGIGSPKGLIPPQRFSNVDNEARQCLTKFSYNETPLYTNDTCSVHYDRILKEGAEWTYLCGTDSIGVDTFRFRFIINDDLNEDIYNDFNTHVYIPQRKFNDGNWVSYSGGIDLHELDGTIMTWWGDCGQCYGPVFDINRAYDEQMVYTFSSEREIFLIDTLITLDGNQRKRVSFAGFDNDTITYVEGIGDLGSFIIPEFNGTLYRYSFNGQLVYENTNGNNSGCEKRIVSTQESLTLEDKFLLYPNPSSSGRFFLESETKSLVKVYNLNGSLVYRSSDPQRMHNIEIVNPYSGLYFVQIQYADGSVQSSRIINNK